MSGFGHDRRISTPSASPVSIFGGSEASASGLVEPLGEKRASVPSTPIFRPVDLPSLENHEEHTRELQKKVSHLTRTMHHNLQYVLKRGSNLTDLEKRLGTLELESKSFQRTAGKVDKKLWWKINRPTFLGAWILATLILVVVAYLILKRVIFY